MTMNPYIVDRIRSMVTRHQQEPAGETEHSLCDVLLMEAAERIEYLENKVEDLEERIAIMSEDQYKCSEIRFP